MQKKIIVLTLFATVLASCGDLKTSTTTQQSQESPIVEPTDPPQTEDENDGVDTPVEAPIESTPTEEEDPVDQPSTPPNNETLSSVCYESATTGKTCFEFYNIDAINAAEPKYSYIDPFTSSGFPSSFNPWQYRNPVNLLFSPQHSANTHLTENFTRGEMLNANSTRGHYGFFSPTVLALIQQMRNHFGSSVIINSAYRSPSYNASIGGAALSRHMYGDAIDFTIPGVSFNTIVSICKSLGAGYTQIYSGHVHCDWRNTPLNEKIYGEDLGPSDSLVVMSMEQAMEREMEIVFEKVAQSRSANARKTPLRFSVQNVILEDGDDVLYEWQVLQQGRVIATSGLAQPVIPLSPGSYQVIVTVGGSLKTSRQLKL